MQLSADRFRLRRRFDNPPSQPDRIRARANPAPMAARKSVELLDSNVASASVLRTEQRQCRPFTHGISRSRKHRYRFVGHA